MIRLENEAVMNLMAAALREGHYQNKSTDPVAAGYVLGEFCGRSEATDTAMYIARAAGVEFDYFQWHYLRLDELRNLPTGKALWWYKRKIKALLP